MNLTCHIVGQYCEADIDLSSISSLDPEYYWYILKKSLSWNDDDTWGVVPYLATKPSAQI